MATYLHRIHCAAITNGCLSFFVWEAEVRSVQSGERLLFLNGWWLDHGRWVCPHHEPPPVPPEYMFGGLRKPGAEQG